MTTTPRHPAHFGRDHRGGVDHRNFRRKVTEYVSSVQKQQQRQQTNMMMMMMVVTIATTSRALLLVVLLLLYPIMILAEDNHDGMVSHDNVGRLDVVMKTMLDDWKVCGASISFYDRNNVNLNGKPIVRGYGKTAQSTSSPDVTPDTAFMIASVSKVFTGTVILQLIKENIIQSLDDDICNVFPTTNSAAGNSSGSSVSGINTTAPSSSSSYLYPSPPSNNTACRHPDFPNVPVTWRMLLTHTSSLVDDIPSMEDGIEVAYGGDDVVGEPAYFGLAGGGSCPLGPEVVPFYRDYMIDKPTETTVGSLYNVSWYELGQQNGGVWVPGIKPGTTVNYSNVGFGYIAALVELALMTSASSSTTTTFPQFSKRTVFDPLQMTNTAWYREDLPTNVTVATPVHYNGWKFVDIGHYCFVDYASGSLYTSMNDMIKFLSSMLQYDGDGTLWDNPQIGIDALTCQEPSYTTNQDDDYDDDDGMACEFGVAWELLANQLKDYYSWLFAPLLCFDWTHGGYHEGYEAGVQTIALVLPEEGIYAAVYTNSEGGISDDGALEMFLEMIRAITGDDCESYRSARTMVNDEITTPPTTSPTPSNTSASNGVQKSVFVALTTSTALLAFFLLLAVSSY